MDCRSCHKILRYPYFDYGKLDKSAFESSTLALVLALISALNQSRISHNITMLLQILLIDLRAFHAYLNNVYIIASDSLHPFRDNWPHFFCTFRSLATL